MDNSRLSVKSHAHGLCIAFILIPSDQLAILFRVCFSYSKILIVLIEVLLLLANNSTILLVVKFLSKQSISIFVQELVEYHLVIVVKLTSLFILH